MGGSADRAPSTNPNLTKLTGSVNDQQNPVIQGLLSQVGSGQMSYKDAMDQIKSRQWSDADVPKAAPYSQDDLYNIAHSAANGGFSGIKNTNIPAPYVDNTSASDRMAAAFQKAAFSNPQVATLIAQSQVMNDPTLQGLFGQGSVSELTQENNGKINGFLDEDREALKGRDQSYGLTDTDLAAYGQASGDIARQFGQTGQNLSQMLASQGLSNSGNAAAQVFSGAMGNQNEQLARLQTGIAQNRIQTAQQLAQARTDSDMQRLGQNSQLMLGLGNLGQTAQTNQFNRNLQTSENGYNQQAGAAGMTMQNQDLQQNVNNSQWAQSNSLGQTLLGIAGGIAGAGAGAAFGSGGGGKK